MAPENRTEHNCGLSKEHPYNLRNAMVCFERRYIANILELTRWNRAKAAQMLGIGQDLLASKINDYQLSPGDKTLPETETKTI
jgi:DNA-binding NtrC family response regulator